jgi:ATP-binding cassette, subfamily B, multidrug efflux pump
MPMTSGPNRQGHVNVHGSVWGPTGSVPRVPYRAKHAKRAKHVLQSPAAASGGTGRRLLRLLRPQRIAVTAVIVLGAAVAVLTALGPRILGRATDLIVAGAMGRQFPAGSTKAQVIAQLRAENRGTLADVLSTVALVPGRGIDFDRVGSVLTVGLGVHLAASLLVFLQGRLVVAIVQRVMFGLRESVSAKLETLPLRFLDRNPTGELLSLVTNDVDNLQQTLQQTLGQLVNAIFSLIGVLVFIFAISPTLAWCLLASAPVSVIVAAVISVRAQSHFDAQWAATGTLNAHVEEAYTGHALVAAFGRHEEAERVFDEHNAALHRAGSTAQSLSGAIQPAMMFLGNITYVVLVVVGAMRVASGSLSIGDVQAFLQYSSQFNQPIAEVASTAGMMQSGIASATRIFALLDETEQEPDRLYPLRPALVRGRVEFEGVSFGYSPEKPLLQDLFLTVEPGQTVAIVGPTGAGKTTLGNLLMRFYELDGGRILLDGTNIAGMSRADLRSNIGLVLQETWLFGGTIAENIGYGRLGASREEIVAAALATNVDRFVRTLPEGYDSVLDDDSTTLSAGEKQLITIARAFLAKPAILLLDEATSSVDTRTEAMIQRAMHSLRSGRTSFVIAHRLSTIRDADLIVVMESGQIVERGTHDELLAQDGFYARLYAAQFADSTTLVG